MKDTVYTVKKKMKNGKIKVYSYTKNYGAKYFCECGSETDKTNFSRHCKSKKHIRLILQNTIENKVCV